MANRPIKPGTPAPVSGLYRVPGSGCEVTVVQGRTLPPTPKAGQSYVLADPAKHHCKPK